LKILLIDNYDSFTHNLFQYFGILGADVNVVRNDKIGIKDIELGLYDKIVISPGPGTPDDSGVSQDVVSYFKGKIPILGVCLGHQVIGQVFGCKVVRAEKVMHGKTSLVYHYGDPIFDGVPSPFTATRYHSLVINRDSVNENLIITAIADDGEIMGVKHKDFDIWGIQFHPESILTKYGMNILKNFLIV